MPANKDQDKRMITVSPAQLGYIGTVIDELPMLTTKAIRQRAIRMIVTALYTMMPKRMNGLKAEHLKHIKKTYEMKDQDSYYEFHFDNGSDNGATINGC